MVKSSCDETAAAVVKNGKAEVSWDLDGISTEGPDAKAWGPEQLKEIMAWNEEHGTLTPWIEKAAALGGAAETPEDPDAIGGEEYGRMRDQQSAEAKAAAKLTEQEMADIAKEALVKRYGMSEAVASQLEWYIPPYSPEVQYVKENGSYCFEVEYLLYLDKADPNANLNGAYVVTVNVETGVIENMTYTAGYGEG